MAALGRIGEENTIGAVLATLDDGSAAVRANGAEALGLIGSPTAIPALVSRLRDEDEEAWVRERTAEALGRIGSDVVLDALSQCLVEPRHSLREAAAEALRRIGAVRRIAIPPDRAPARLRASIQAFADACRARQDPASSPGS